MTSANTYLLLCSVISMFILLCLAVYSYGLKLTKDVRRDRSSSAFTISQYFDSEPTRQLDTVYNTRTDLPPSYEQVVIGINVVPAPIPATESTRVQ